MSDPAPRVSVLTPTFDRRDLLPRLYESLRAQTMQSLEWVVIDDGSTDGTDELVRGWVAEAPFPIVYRRQPNQGKHVALNRAFELARGTYSAMIDSDDAYRPEALERLLAIWDGIPPAERERFASVEARCGLPDGTPVGTAPPAPVLDSDYFDIWARHAADGDTIGMFRTDVLAAHPFPEEPVGVLVTESLIWHRIALRYRTRFVDEVLAVKEYQASGLTARPHALWVRDAVPMRLYFGELLAMPRPMPRRLRFHAAANYVRYSLHAGVGPARIWRETGRRRVLFAALPAGVAVYARDRWRVARG